jgi:hypothetical protein
MYLYLILFVGYVKQSLVDAFIISWFVNRDMKKLCIMDKIFSCCKNGRLEIANEGTTQNVFSPKLCVTHFFMEY